MILTGAALIDVLTRNGFNTAQTVIAYGIIMAESGGNTQAVHTNSDGSVDRGMWQINSTHVASGAISEADCFDPNASTQYAYKLSHGGTAWGDWTTYNSGAYQRFEPKEMDGNAAMNPLGAITNIITGGPIVDAVRSALSAVLGPMFSAIGDTLTNTGLVLLGTALVIGGVGLVVVIVRQQLPSHLARTVNRSARLARTARFLAAA